MNYKKIYDNLILRAKERAIKDCYIEEHHIAPRCMGGSDEPENLVELLPEEHFIAHLLLTKIYPESYKLLVAFILMCGQRKMNNKTYKTLRIKYIEGNKKSYEEKFGLEKSLEIRKQKSNMWSGSNNPMYGHKHTEETLIKMKKPLTEEHKIKLRKPKSTTTNMKGKKSELAKQKMSKTRIERGIGKGDNNPGHKRKGRTYEEIYGVEKAQQIRERQSLKHLNMIYKKEKKLYA